ncbi:general odorant-binding protein 84a-like [Eurosta solidaginis]|uniref:general odorant-binding protein 84a-like n=1 Tax=Eurosta solidaginis TaxID=178769 RepID=UPI003531327E
MSLKRYGNTLCFLKLALLLFCIVQTANAQSTVNGQNDQMATDTATSMGRRGDGEQGFNFTEVVKECNSSFTIPLEYMQQFNETAELPNTTDKTGMCFLRCYMETTGIIRNWKLNRSLIRKTMWPATGDSIPVCEKEGANETCPCKRSYAIAKCLMIRAIVDAPSKPIV